ncbi:MAG: hypothetical protein JOZ75_08885 [Candidatus Dormibacteraeota bacterium]|nr:hypothetical protein [Candidatus Dormibacteraeota bacterium]
MRVARHPHAVRQEGRSTGAQVQVQLVQGIAGRGGEAVALVQPSKEGTLYLLDRDHLGGRDQGPGGTDAAVAEAGPQEATFSQPLVWPKGGLIFVAGTVKITAQQPSPTLRAFRVVDSGTRVRLLLAASAPTVFGYGSGSPVLADSAKSPLVWVIERPAGNEIGGGLRAYGATPDKTSLDLMAAFPMRDPAKFSSPVIVRGDEIVAADGTGEVMALRMTPAGAPSPPPQGPGSPAGPVIVAALAVAAAAVGLFFRRRSQARR